MALNLYLVERDDDMTWDENWGHVVAADDDYAARLFASRVTRDEAASVWFEESTKVQMIGVASSGVDAGIVLTDGHSG